MSKLPIEAAIPQLIDALATSPNAVLQAPPGAGKTTRVPLALLDQAWLQGKKILMLEPRRLAARNAAYWMAHTLGEEAGQTVGYRMRMDHKVSGATRIEVVTEGILTRLIQDDPELAAYGLVIFDEFHERSLQADLGLALCLDAQENLRPDLRILVMSATLDGEPIAKLLDAPIVTSEGRSYPVTTRYFNVDLIDYRDEPIVQAIMLALNQESGSILVFLPGSGEIRRVAQRLSDSVLPARTYVYPLYADLSRQEQEAAIEPAQNGVRKIVLATSIAETSLTIEGVRVVIDSGLQRLPQFDPGTGMTQLTTIRVSKAAADQRQGRAGRTEPGVCFRLWSESVQTGLIGFNTPEILQADLAPLALELANWGITQPNTLRWLNAPLESNYEQARDLLKRLDAMAPDNKITAHGKQLLKLGTHPRLAHMILHGKALGLGSLACRLAALLDERDILRGPAAKKTADLQARLEALTRRDAATDNAARQRVIETSRRWLRQLAITEDTDSTEGYGTLVALAYPDRVGQLRSNTRGRYRLSNGRGAILNESDPLASSPYISIAHLDGQGADAKIYIAAPISLDEIFKNFPNHCIRRDSVEWSDTTQSVSASQRVYFGDLVLQEKPIARPDENQILAGVLKGIRKHGLQVLPWSDFLRQWQQRVLLLRATLGEQHWPDVSDQALLESLDAWLAPFLTGVSRFSQLANIDLKNALYQLLDWDSQKKLDDWAPTHYVVPSGSNIPIDYASGNHPVLAVRLQEMFGLAETPRIANGKIPLTLHLLSPAHRPVQVTQDLANFWATTYNDVKKELKGRYPKHYWPDDPLQAEATRRAKPRNH